MRLRALLSPLKALVRALLILIVAELLLSFVYPWRYPTPLPYQRAANGEWSSSLAPGVPRIQARPQLFDPIPSADQFRVVVVGSSAVFGQNFTLFQSFPWKLQRLLQRRGINAEVINLGRCALDSGDHLAVLRAALPILKPGLVIIYCGNNEFHRLRAYGELNPGWSAEVERVRLLLQRFAVYRAIVAWASRETDPGEVITGATQAGNARQGPAWSAHSVLPELRAMRTRVTTAGRLLATAQYLHNMGEMAAICHSQGARVVVCTVADSELSPPEFGEVSDDSIRAAVDRAEALVRKNAADEARSVIAGELGRKPQDSRLNYEMGLLDLAGGNLDAARRELSFAMEMDARPTRALPSFAEALRGLASRGGIPLCDLEQRLRSVRADGLLGPEVFCDNCHFGVVGNELVAAELDRFLAERALIPPGTAAQESPATASRAPDPLDLEQTTLDYRLVQEEGHLILSGHAPSRPDTESRLQQMLGCPLPQASDDPRGMVLRAHMWYGLGEFAQAAGLYRQAIRKGLTGPAVWRNLGHASVANGDPAEALVAYRRYLELGGSDPIMRWWVALLERARVNGR